MQTIAVWRYGLRVTAIRAGRRALAVGADHQAGANDGAVGEGRGGAILVAVERRDLGGCAKREPGQLRRAREQRPPERPVLDDVAKRLVANIAMIVVKEQRRIRVGHANFEDRLLLAFDALPDSQGLEQPRRSGGDRADPAIERALQARLGRQAVD